MDVLFEIIGAIFESVWGLLSGVPVPMLGVSFAEWFLAIALIGLSIRVVALLLGLGGSGSGYRSGQSGRKHISEGRKGDEL